MFQSDNFALSVDESGVAELYFNAPGSVNKLAVTALQELDSALDEIIENQEQLKGLLIYSAKESFILGADITEFLALFDLPEEQLADWLKKANAIFCKLEDLPFPTATAINGFCLGGGMELALSTDFRVCDETARLGFPEVKLGIMPGFGGTVRLPRIIGADNALEWITTGKQYKAEAALNVSAIDAVVNDPKQLLKVTQSILLDAYHEKLDWQQRRRAKLEHLPLSGSEALMSFSTAKAMVFAKAGIHYPAPMAAVEAISLAAETERSEALAIERAGFLELAKSNEARALVGLFLGDQYLKGLAKKAAKAANSIEHAAVLGAGIMGGGIAYQAASRGTQVLLKDIQPAALKLGLDEASKLLTKQLERQKISPAQMANTLNAIVPTLSYEPLSACQIVVEAVIENPKIKGQVLAEVENAVPNDCIITSNTSTISIDQLAKSLKNPSRFCGMHFFNPVHRMPLVEVIRGKETSDKTIATVVSWATQMGKSCVVVNDCPGFFVNRVLFPYFQAFAQLVAEGVDFETIDQVMEKTFGWPMGPAYLLDVVGIDTAHHARAVMAEGFPERMKSEPGDAIDYLYQKKLYGQKTSQGFYLYQASSKGKPDKLSNQQLRSNLVTKPPVEMGSELIIQRMMTPMVLETIRCLEEEVVASPIEADMALIYGLGFPPFRGGVFRHIETMGLNRFIEIADSLKDLGPLYQVTSTMRKRAKQGLSYLNPKPGADS